MFEEQTGGPVSSTPADRDAPSAGGDGARSRDDSLEATSAAPARDISGADGSADVPGGPARPGKEEAARPLNGETERQTARDSTVGPERPLGERGAVVADSAPPYEDEG